MSDEAVAVGMQLPPEIILNILSRLPADTILQCECVCKTWRDLLLINKHDPYFAKMHLHHRALEKYQFGFLLFNGFDDGRSNEFHFAEYTEPRHRRYEDEPNISYKVRKMDYPENLLGSPDWLLVGSCNGLVCLAEPEHGYAPFSDPIYICNPLTKEHVKLPRFENYKDIHGRRQGDMSFGFGYHPRTDEYKVVRIYCSPSEGSHVTTQVEVHTLGKDCGIWRDKGDIPYNLDLHTESGVLADGALCWLTTNNGVAVFDLANEEFHMVSLPPPCLGKLGTCGFPYQLVVLGGLLCLYEIEGYEREIWILKNGWVNKYSIVGNANYHLGLRRYEPCSLKKNGELLLWYNFYELLATYDPKRGTVKVLERRECKNMMEMGFEEGIPHVKSFVSLKALGEEDAEYN